mgnify:CR=1 FL=1
MARNIIDKIWAAHVIEQQPDHPAIFAIDRILLHEVTSAQAFDLLRQKGLSVYRPERCLATVDHSIPTTADRHIIRDQLARKQVETLRQNAKEFGIQLYDFDSQYQGIVHVMGPELGFTWPGSTLVCGDSHTSTHGAFGALAFGIGTSEVGHVLATGSILQHQPKTMCVAFNGHLQPGVTAKDAIMKLIATIGAAGHVIEYRGPAVEAMSMEARMTLCNMSIECGARAGLIAPDQTTFDYLQNRPYAPQGDAWQQAVDRWQNWVSDPGCQYDRYVALDLDQLAPMVSWGVNPEQAIALDETLPQLTDLPETHHSMAQQAYDYTGLVPGQRMVGQKIDWAFIGSCTNGRIEDLRLAADYLRDQKIADHVTMYVVPGSEQVMQQAKAEGLDQIFTQAGAQFRMPGCSMCLAMNDDKVPPGARCMSTSNRNFIGRQGPSSITHLASPATVAASAVAGQICQARSSK